MSRDLSAEASTFSDYLVFVDESGDHSLVSIDPVFPVFALSFCIVSKSVYADEILPRVTKLKQEIFGHDEIILHEHEIRKKKGDFSALSETVRDYLLDQLSTIMSDVDLVIIGVVIDKVAHKQKYDHPNHPYHLALLFGLERVYEFLRIEDQQGRTHVICECRGAKEDKELELQFRRICDGQNRHSKSYDMEVVFKDKKSNSVGLQLADITARPLALSKLRPNQPNRALEIIKTKLYTGRWGVVYGNGLKYFP